MLKVKAFARHRGGVAVGKMPAVGQFHGQDAITDVKYRKIDRKISSNTTVRLNIGVLGPKKIFGPGNSQLFQFIRMPAAGVEPVSGKSLSGLKVKNRPLSLQNRCRCMIFRGNQVQRVFNSGFFGLDDAGHLRIIFNQIWHNLPSRNLYNLIKACGVI